MAFMFYITPTDVSQHFLDPYWDKVVLATNFDNSPIVDSKENQITSVGSTLRDTNITKYGSGSLYTNNSALGIAESPAFVFPGQFTIEYWIRFNTVVSTMTMFNFGTTKNGIDFVSGVFRYVQAGAVITSASFTPVANVWYHIAVSRDASNVIRLFLDGVQYGSSVTNSSIVGTAPAPFAIGGRTTAGGFTFDGYIDDFRVTKGIARYTTNFTPPTAILIGSNTAANTIGTVIYGAQYNASSFGGAWAVFDEDPVSRWFPFTTNNTLTWVGLHYATTKTVSGFSFTLQTAHTLYSYAIEYSSNGTSWNTFYTTTGSWGNGVTVSGSATPVSASYWRLRFLTGSDIANITVNKLEFH